MAADIIALPQLRFDERQIELMRRTIGKDVPPEEFAFFLEVAMSRGLNPFNREIHPTMRGGRLVILTGIDGFRKLADGSGLYRGQIGPFFCGKDGEWKDAWLEDGPPVCAKVGVLRAGFESPMWAVARYTSYVQKDKQGNITDTWKKLPDIMLAKCCEALALRKAFPAHLAGLYVYEEMMQAETPTASRNNVPSLKTLCIKAQDTGLLDSVDAFYSFCSEALHRQVTRDNGKSVTATERMNISKAIDAAIAAMRSPVVEQEEYMSIDEVSQELAEQEQSA